MAIRPVEQGSGLGRYGGGRERAESHPGRALLEDWEAAKPANFYLAQPLLERLVRRWSEGRSDLAALERFGALCAGAIDAAARENDRLGNHPRLERYDGIGVRTEAVVFHPSYHEAGRHVWKAGLVSCLAEPGSVVHQSALAYLLAHDGEMGHLCPVTCTSGLVRALQKKGSPELQERWLPGLLTADYERRLHGSQFLTEIQGGSDVGAILVRAEEAPEVPGAYRLYGEKWFCSVIDAALFMVVARPQGAPSGTAGLGCFLVPRHLDDGSPNGFAIRRLKEKIGTRAMASAEIDFDGALAWPIGPLEEGFKTAVGIVLNTSRLMNALGSAGAMGRAYLEASSYAQARTAFGHPIGRFPLVRQTLASMKAEGAAALTSTLYLAHLVDRIDLGTAGPEDVLAHRFLVNANKYWTSVAGTRVVQQGIEILGGNGAIETFSVLPRLWRDSIVLESWEGAHNVLCLQVLRDAARLDLWAEIQQRVAGWLGQGREIDPRLVGLLEPVLESALADASRCLADPDGHGAWHIRRAVERWSQLVQAALLLDQAAHEKLDEDRQELLACARLLTGLHLLPHYRPEDDPDLPAIVDAVIGADLAPL
jgi:acyl-CoA dehydrogenase